MWWAKTTGRATSTHHASAWMSSGRRRRVAFSDSRWPSATNSPRELGASLAVRPNPEDRELPRLLRPLQPDGAGVPGALARDQLVRGLHGDDAGAVRAGQRHEQRIVRLLLGAHEHAPAGEQAALAVQ